MGPNGDGTSSEKNLLKSFPKEGPTKLYEIDLGRGYAPPCIAGEKLFHFDRFESGAEPKNRLTCREAATGKELWKVEYNADYEDTYGFDPGPRCCPIADAERVFVYGPEGMLVAYQIADGKEVWSINTREKYTFQQNFFGVASTPWIEDGKLIVAIGGSEKGPKAFDIRDVKGNGTGIVAFDCKTGKELWKISDELASYASPIVTTINKQRVGLYFGRCGLVLFDPINGKELTTYHWRAKIRESVNAANPVVSGDTIFISESYELGSVALKWDGVKLNEVWSDREKDRSDKAMLAHWCTPMLVNGYLYGCSSRHSGEADIRCVDFKTGDIKWKKSRIGWQTVVMYEDMLLFLGENGQVRLVKPNAEKLEEISTFTAELKHPAWAPPVLSNGRLFLRGAGKMIVYDIKAK